MHLTQIIYVSRLNEQITMPELRKLVQQSSVNNIRLDITGVLLVKGSSLMQLLEGDAVAVDSLYAKISKDRRHSEIECLLRKSVLKRLYPEWGMGLAELNSPLILNRPRMARMISDIRDSTNTKLFSVEARVLLKDFQQQAEMAA